MSERLIEIHPGSEEWDAWLRYHRGTKTETRMLGCLGGKRKSGEIVAPRPWRARSKFPPAAPRDGGLTRNAAPAPAAKPERRSIGDGELDAVAARLEARDKRNATELKTKKRRSKEAERSEKTLEIARKKVLAGADPRLNGGDDIGMLKIDDPIEGRVRTKIIALRNDPVGQMMKRGQLGAAGERDARLTAARRWQALYEAAEIGGARGIDPTREYVDGGRFEMPDTDARLQAQKRLGELSRLLGIVGERIVVWVLGEKLNLAEVAERLGAGKQEREALGHLLRWQLDLLVVELGVGHGDKGAQGPRRRRDQFDDLARFSWNARLYDAVHRAKRR